MSPPSARGGRRIDVVRGALAPALLCALAAGGCASTPYVRPALEMPARYAAGDPAAPERVPTPPYVAATAAGADAWWRGYGDEALDRLVDDVLARNPDLAIAARRIEQARLEVARVRVQRWPVADGSVAASATQPLDGGATTRTASADLAIGWEADLFGRLRADARAARFDAEATAADRDATALALAAEAVSQYWTLAARNEQVALGAVSLDTAQRTRALVEAQYRAGAVSALERNEAAQSLQQQIRAQSERLQQLAATRNAIARLRGGTPWPLEDEPPTLRAPALAIDAGAPAALLVRRPDLRASELRLRGALADLDAVRASYAPTLSISASAGGSARTLADAIADPVGTLTGLLRLPFLDVGTMRVDIARGRGEVAIAQDTLRGDWLDALNEAEDALSARDRAAEQQVAAERALAAAAEVERLYGVRYRVGAASLRVWLDAQEARRSAEQTRVQAALSRATGDVTLVRALGGAAPP